ncbi:MAG: dihydrofolate reductase [Ruminiclostridium sp.]|nr:dihydrofolate reductase [Ruminiclostridium sp.]
MKAILSVDKNWGIGYKGDLLKRIPEDMRFFKQTTMGKVVVMGRSTFESLPGREPLKGRTNIVLSTNKDYSLPGVTICISLKELFEITSSYAEDDVYVIGGAQVYSELLPFCSEAIITKFEETYDADAFFPDLDKDDSWTPVILAEALQHNDLRYSRVKYVNSRIVQFT